MTATELLALAERIEQAGADEQRELLEDAFYLLHPIPADASTRWRAGRQTDEDEAHHKRLRRFQTLMGAEAFESAALMLIDPERYHWTLESRSFWLRWLNAGVVSELHAKAATPALAVAAAALRARAEKDTTP